MASNRWAQRSVAFLIYAGLAACTPRGHGRSGSQPPGTAPPPPLGGPPSAASIAHAGATALAFDSSGRRFAIGGNDGPIELRDAQSGAPLAVLRGHAGKITGLAFAPDGVALASTSLDGTGRIWDTVRGVEITPGGPPQPNQPNSADALSVAWSPAGDLLAFAFHDSGVRIYDPKSGNLRAILWPWHSGAATSLSFRRDGSSLAVGMRNGEIDVWNTRRGSRFFTLRPHRESINSVAFSNDGTRIASAADDTSIVVSSIGPGGSLDLRSAPRRERKDQRVVLQDTFIAWSPDDRSLAVGEHDGSVNVFPSDGAAPPVRAFEAASVRTATTVAWSPLGAPLVAARSSGGFSLLRGGAIASAPSPPPPAEIAPKAASLDSGGNVRARINGIAFSPDGSELAASTMSVLCETRIWNQRGDLISTLEGHAATFSWSVAFAHDKRTLGRTTSRGMLEVWDLPTQKLRTSIKLGKRQSSVLAFSPDDRVLASDGGDGHGARLWNPRNGAPLATLDTGDCNAETVAFSGDGRLLAVRCHGDDGIKRFVELWDVQTKKLVKSRSTDGSFGDFFFDPSPRVWLQKKARPATPPKQPKKKSKPLPDSFVIVALDLETGKETLSIPSPTSGSVAGNRNGTLVSAGGRVWDAKSGSPLFEIPELKHARDVAFSDDGARLAAGFSDATVRFYDVRTGARLDVVGGE